MAASKIPRGSKEGASERTICPRKLRGHADLNKVLRYAIKGGGRASQGPAVASFRRT